jgi:hypothetical protein
VRLAYAHAISDDPAKHLFRLKNIASLQSEQGRFAPLRRGNKSSMRLLAKADEQ